MENSNFLHWNRDENSFTARLFEGILFPKFKKSKEAFNEFLKLLEDKSNHNLYCIKNKFPSTNITSWKNEKELSFKDGMLFLECVDMFSYIKHEFINEKGKENLEKISKYLPDKIPDKTEFDCVILCEDKDHREHLIVFEVKCYTDLNSKELNRQHNWLEIFKGTGLIHNYYHFGLIAYDNLKNAQGIFNCKNFKDDNLFILTWEDFRQYVTESDGKRFYEKIDCELYKTIGIYGNRGNKRFILKNSDNSSDEC